MQTPQDQDKEKQYNPHRHDDDKRIYISDESHHRHNNDKTKLTEHM